MNRLVNGTFMPYSVAFRGKSLSPSTGVDCAFVWALVFVFVFTGMVDLALVVRSAFCG
jgi:hypothetical protein